MYNSTLSSSIRILGVIVMMAILSGCSTMINNDTKLSLKGPKAEVSRAF